jgi:hypothetical protein
MVLEQSFWGLRFDSLIPSLGNPGEGRVGDSFFPVKETPSPTLPRITGRGSKRG